MDWTDELQFDTTLFAGVARSVPHLRLLLLKLSELIEVNWKTTRTDIAVEACLNIPKGNIGIYLLQVMQATLLICLIQCYMVNKIQQFMGTYVNTLCYHMVQSLDWKIANEQQLPTITLAAMPEHH